MLKESPLVDMGGGHRGRADISLPKFSHFQKVVFRKKWPNNRLVPPPPPNPVGLVPTLGKSRINHSVNKCFSKVGNKFKNCITDHVLSTREGNVFTGISHSVQGGRGWDRSTLNHEPPDPPLPGRTSVRTRQERLPKLSIPGRT